MCLGKWSSYLVLSVELALCSLILPVHFLFLFYSDLYVQEYVPFPVINKYMRPLKKDTCINVVRFHLPMDGRLTHGTDRHGGLDDPPEGM